ncbi:molybdopterin-dependent oxidoreductase [Streptosporangium sp. NPDC002524]|uniref:molybdopterin-dependent oxidoreductase n=1 Tax=Streptosporangium sp. NPDC002524 TaxID=3154537 RepID=UPI00332453A5
MRHAVRAAGAGLLPALAALGGGELAAGLLGPRSSPLVAVGGTVIDLTPTPVKEFAVSAFGTYDKLVLIGTIIIVLLAAAVLLGFLAAAGRRAWAAAGVAGLGALGALAAGTRPAAVPLDVVPSLVAAGVGALTLLLLTRAATGTAPPSKDTGAAPSKDIKTTLPKNTGTAPSKDSGTAPAKNTRTTPPKDTGAEPAKNSGTTLPKNSGTTLPKNIGAAPPKNIEAAPVEGDEVLSDRGTAPSASHRRAFLLTGAGAGAAFAAGRLLSSRVPAATELALPAPASPARPLPAGTDLRVPGLSPFVTPAADFYRVDTALVVPRPDLASWTLRVHGTRTIELTMADVLRRGLIERDITLTCVSNEVGGPYAGNARWLGVPLPVLLREAGVPAGADQLLSTSADGWTCGTPIEIVMDGRDAMLAVGMNGRALPAERGFPARLLVPGLYGYVSATKWVVDLRLTRYADERAYWTERGWAVDAPVKTMSRIDVPAPLERLPAGTVRVAGVAWAQHRGVAAVEVRVDGGPWQEATLAATPGPDTWRQWTWTWRATSGTHTLESRATDATGSVQRSSRVTPFPDGATGWHSVVVTVA